MTEVPGPERAGGAGPLATLDALDRRVSRRMTATIRADGSVRPWIVPVRRFSQAGSYGVGWVAAFVVIGALTDGIVPALVAGACVLATLVLNTVVKRLIRRPRPTIQAIKHAPSSWSMPSAHTAMAMVGAATMSVLVPELAPLLWIVAVLLGVSRVVLGMHFVGDVVAGAVFGLVLSLVVFVPLVERVAS